MNIIFALLILMASCFSAEATVSLGSNIEYIPSAKSLGIGFTSPSEKLAVNGNILSNANLQGETLILAGTTIDNFSNFFTNGTAATGTNRNLGNLDDYALGLITNGNTALTVSATGSVGIGDTTPDYLLDVAGTLGVDGVAALSSAAVGGGYGDSGVTISGAGAIQADGAITAASTLDVTSTSTMAANLTLSGTAANILTNANYLSGDGGDEGVNVDSSGNVGIGTASQNEKLTVAGSLGLLEGTAASNTASYGKLYVSSTDSQLYFTDDSNNAHRLSFGDNGGILIDNLTDAIHSSSAKSIYIGVSSGSLSGAGTTNNLAMGFEAMKGSGAPTGDYNTAFGYQSIKLTTSGSYNTMVGYRTGGGLGTNLSGSRNTGIGNQSLYQLSSGADNTCLSSSGSGHTTHSYGTSFGGTAMNNGGAYNNAFGYTALAYVGGTMNLALGENTYMGSPNRTGCNYNVGLGSAAGGTIGNTAIGNTNLGAYAQYNMGTSTYNTQLGAYAGYNITTGDYNLVIGSYNVNPYIDVASATGDYQMNIHNTIYADLSTDSVGINDLTPDFLLDVNGTLGVAGAATLASTLDVTGASTLSANLSLTGTAANILLGSNYLSGDGGDEGVFVDSSGNVGIGNAAPGSKLHITGSDNDVLLLSDGADCEAQPDTGALTWSCSSDIRLKSNIRPASSVMDDIMSFNIKEFTFIPTGKHSIGVIAQEVQTIHPELVTQGQDGYLRVTGLNQWKLIKAIQELDADLKKLKANIIVPPPQQQSLKSPE